MLKAPVIFFLAALAVLGAAEPFQWRAETVDGKLEVSVDIAPGYYLTLENILTQIRDAHGKLPPVLSLPRKTFITDPEQGRVAVLPEGRWRWVYGGTPPYQVKVAFQGCRKGAPGTPPVCLMPRELQLTGVETPGSRAEMKAVDSFYRQWRVVKRRAGAMNKEEFLSFLAAGESSPAKEKNLFAGAPFLLIVLLTLLGGIGLNLTPCVLPMIPVNLAIISGGESGAAGFRRGLLYGGGMAVAYGILGAAAVFTGASLGNLNSSSWFNFAVAALFAVLAAAMFGIFNFDFSRFARVSPGRLKVGRDAAAFVMGALAALLAGACVAPVVAGVLIFAAGLYADGNVFAPFMGLLLGAGMGLPWPFAAAGLAVLPKPGKFMVTVKYLFAVLILLGAFYYAYLGWSLRPGNFSPQAELVKLAEAGDRAAAGKKPLLVDFYASWCKNCAAMKRTTLKDPEVIEALKKYEFVEFRAEKPGDPLIAPLLKLWDVPGFPAFVILQP